MASSPMAAILRRVHAFLPSAGASGSASSLSVAVSRGLTVRFASTDGAAAAAGPATASPLVTLPQTFRLNDLRDNPGANKPKRKKGRGVGGGHGLARSAGEGSKGQKSHQGGGIPLGFEGGQSPLWRRTPKYGYMNKMFRREMDIVNLSQLQLWIDQGRIDSSQPITLKTLVDAGLVNKVKFGIKLLGEGADDFKSKVDITVSQASGSAIAAVEKAGGSILSVYHSPLALRSVLKPHKFETPLRSPAPPPKVARYYLKAENRGYLSPEVQLAEVKKRLAAGMPLPLAAAVNPVFVGGAALDTKRHIIDIAVDAPATVAAAAAATPAPQAATAAQ